MKYIYIVIFIFCQCNTKKKNICDVNVDSNLFILKGMELSHTRVLENGMVSNSKVSCQINKVYMDTRRIPVISRNKSGKISTVYEPVDNSVHKAEIILTFNRQKKITSYEIKSIVYAKDSTLINNIADLVVKNNIYSVVTRSDYGNFTYEAV